MPLNLKRISISFVLFFLLFSAYDLSVLFSAKINKDAVNLSPYLNNRDGRIDETLMYMPWAAKINQYGFAIGDSYLKEHTEDPNLKPQIPALISSLLLRASPSLNEAYILLHAVTPSLTAILYMFFLSVLFPALGFWGIFAVTVITFTELVFVPGALFSQTFKFFDLGMFSRHWFSPWEHLKFSRFFSPGMTFFGIVLALFWFAYSKHQKNWQYAVSGFLVGLQFYIYPHHILVLGLVFLGLCLMRLAKMTDFLKHLLIFAVSFLICSIPFATSMYHLKMMSTAKDIIYRVGYLENFRLYLFVIFMLLLSGLVMGVSRLRRPDFFRSETNSFLLCLLLANIISIGIGIVLGQFHVFPQPWLIPSRVSAYIIPLLILGAFLSRERKFWKWAGVILYALAIGQEIRASKIDFPLYIPSAEDSAFREAIAKIEEGSVVLAPPNSKSAILVGETSNFSYIGYGINSSASNDELLRRLMIYAILKGQSFKDFVDKIFWQSEFPEGLAGKHWVYHHGSEPLNNYRQDDAGKTYFTEHFSQDMEATYEKLTALEAAQLLQLYRLDYLYLPLVIPKYISCVSLVSTSFYKVKDKCKL